MPASENSIKNFLIERMDKLISKFNKEILTIVRGEIWWWDFIHQKYF